jgi:hypothetical protein
VNLLFFVADLARDAKKQQEFFKDPDTYMKNAGLSDQQQQVVNSRKAHLLAAAIALEIELTKPPGSVDLW